MGSSTARPPETTVRHDGAASSTCLYSSATSPTPAVRPSRSTTDVGTATSTCPRRPIRFSIDSSVVEACVWRPDSYAVVATASSSGKAFSTNTGRR